MDRRKWMQLSVILIVGGFLATLAMGLRASSDVVAVGDPGYEFELEDVHGQLHRLSDYQGQVVVLNVFASWCVPCVEEAPELEAFERELKDQAKLLIIVRGEPKEPVVRFIEEQRSTSTYLFDYNMKVVKKYQATGQPETLIIDREGIIREHIIGVVTKDMLEEKVKIYQ